VSAQDPIARVGQSPVPRVRGPGDAERDDGDDGEEDRAAADAALLGRLKDLKLALPALVRGPLPAADAARLASAQAEDLQDALSQVEARAAALGGVLHASSPGARLLAAPAVAATVEDDELYEVERRLRRLAAECEKLAGLYHAAAPLYRLLRDAARNRG
jgi:hypothetical protein